MDHQLRVGVPARHLVLFEQQAQLLRELGVQRRHAHVAGTARAVWCQRSAPSLSSSWHRWDHARCVVSALRSLSLLIVA
jgi:hypothetical protein